MKIILAGFNTDIHNEHKIKSPETISAAYARISRAKQSVDKLREIAADDVKSARRSNQNIIFDLGHSSIAEHAVFNFDIIDVSRLMAEYIQHHRLASYTEKSQRYVKFNNSYYIPDDIRPMKLKQEFISFCDECFSLYETMLNVCKEKNIESGAAKEDIRYILPLATLTQMGMTVNARTLEYMISDLNSQELLETKSIANALYKCVNKLTPSVIKYIDERELLKKVKTFPNYSKTKDIELVDFTADGERKIIASMLFEKEGLSYKKAYSLAKCGKRRKVIAKKMFSQMALWDRPLRAFENAYFTFNINLSSSAFAQLKRHRISTINAQAYNFNMKPIVPETIKKIGYKDKYLELAERSNDLMKKLAKQSSCLSEYACINGTRRNVLISMNARELYHFIRLRSDSHAQWEIRDISNRISEIVKEKFPVIFALAGGKDKYNSLKESIDGL